MKIFPRLEMVLLFVWVASCGHTASSGDEFVQIGAAADEETVLVPVVDGTWWQIVDDNPDVSPFKLVEPGRKNVCDFTIWQDAKEKWLLLACVRYTAHPGDMRLSFKRRTNSVRGTRAFSDHLQLRYRSISSVNSPTKK